MSLWIRSYIETCNLKAFNRGVFSVGFVRGVSSLMIQNRGGGAYMPPSKYTYYEILNSMFLPLVKKISLRAHWADGNISLCFISISFCPWMFYPRGRKLRRGTEILSVYHRSRICSWWKKSHTRLWLFIRNCFKELTNKK